MKKENEYKIGDEVYVVSVNTRQRYSRYYLDDLYNRDALRQTISKIITEEFSGGCKRKYYITYGLGDAGHSPGIPPNMVFRTREQALKASVILDQESRDAYINSLYKEIEFLKQIKK